MVMRQRTSGATASRPRPVATQTYQDFQPVFEWKQEEGCAVLVVYLPGFTKEQLGVQLQNMDRLRIRGTRPARANTWIRFDKSFPLPEDCSTSGIQAKFEDGILYATFQKKKKDIQEVGSEEKQAKPTRQTPLSPPKPVGEVKDSIPPKPSSSIGAPDEQRDEKGSQFPSPQVVSPPTASTSGGDGKSVEAPSKLKSETEMDKETDLKQTIPTTQGKGQTEAKSMEALTKPKSPEVEDTNLGKARTASVGDNIPTGAKNTEALTKPKSPEVEDTNLGKASTASVGDNIPTGAKNTEALSSEKALSNKPKAEKGGEDQRAVDSPTSEGPKNTEKVVEKPTAGEERGKTYHDDMKKPTAAEKPENALGKAPDQKKPENSEKIGKESKPTAENVIQKRVAAAIEKYSNATKEGRTTKNAVGGGYTYGKYKQIVKDFMTPKAEEERKLLVNIGVAALVIVALGAYITYSRWTSDKPKNQ